MAFADPQIERLTAIIAPLAEVAGYELVRVRLMGGGNTSTLQIMAEKADGTMTANNCAELSRALSAAFEEDDPMEGAYNLEVSSPGIDRPLTRMKDFDRWEGFHAKLELTQMIEGRKRFKGVLAGTESDNICIDLEGEEDTALIPFDLLATAKLVLTDDLIRETLRAAKAAGIAPDDTDEEFIEKLEDQKIRPANKNTKNT